MRLWKGWTLTGTWPWWWVWCRFLCQVCRWCCTWMAEVGGACVCDRIPAAEGCSAAVLRASLIWLQSPHKGSCCPGRIAANHIQGSRLNQSDYKRTAVYPPLCKIPCRLWHSIRKSVDCWCHTPDTPRHRRGRPPTGSQNLASPHGAGVQRKKERRKMQRSSRWTQIDILLCSSYWSIPAGTSPDHKRKSCW